MKQLIDKFLFWAVYTIVIVATLIMTEYSINSISENIYRIKSFYCDSQTIGTIMSFKLSADSSDFSYYAAYCFEVDDTQYKITSPLTWDLANGDIGDKVRVLYNKNNPNIAALELELVNNKIYLFNNINIWLQTILGNLVLVCSIVKRGWNVKD